MEGRRVSRKNQKYNPLFILFLCLVAAVVVLLVVSVVLGIRLGKANKTLKESEASVKELTQTVSRLEDELEKAKKTSSGGGSSASVPALPSDGGPSASTPAAGSSWLDLSGHNEVKVPPTDLLDGYTVYYTTAGVNLRSGPGKDYDRITTVDYGEKVQVAARENGWSFAKVGGKFGWLSSDYLSTKEPAPQTASKPSTSSSGSSRVEATSGSLRQ